MTRSDVCGCGIRYGVADLNRIRARLSGARRDVERRLEQRQRAPEGPAARTAPSRSAEVELERERTLRKQLEARCDELEAALGRADAAREEWERRAGALEQELAGGALTDGRHAEIERTCALLERELAGARLQLEQVRVGRDRARAELEGMGAELRKAQFLLEAERAQAGLHDEEAVGSKRAQRKRRASQSEKRIAELEGELESERELRKDFELALELAQQQEADDRRRLAEAERAPFELRAIANREGAPQQTVVAAETNAGPKLAETRPRPQPAGPGADGWGVPLEAFPVDQPEEEPDAAGKRSRNERSGRRTRFRRGGRTAGR
jgi:hypothetical protein